MGRTYPMKCMHQMPTTPIAVAHIMFSSLREMSVDEQTFNF
jgi:hypothetical protein